MARPVLSFLLACTLVAQHVRAYTVPVLDTDYSRQTCSGMWASDSTFINVTFDASSQGQVAMVIYEWADSPYLGKVTDTNDDFLPKTYVCTSNAAAAGFCTRADLGRFILDLPKGAPINETSFWSARVSLPGVEDHNRRVGGVSGGARDGSAGGDSWNNPEGNSTPPPSVYNTPWRKRGTPSSGIYNPSPSGVYHYKNPIQYLVRKTGYYCVAIVPVTIQPGSTAGLADSDPTVHPSYKGTVLFQNSFHGELPATDYPKVNFYLSMFLIYTAFGAIWGWLCYKYVHELLPIQYYLSGLIGLLVIEMFANWAYYRYLNAHNRSTASTIFLIVVAILDAGRNSMSFFMLLVVSLGLSVVRESLGKTMLRCQILAGLHFVFGILYAVGIVELELESTSALVLLLFIIPLAFTLSGFLLWIMYALNSTIAQLRTRKQHYKLGMFQRLYYVLLFTVFVIAIFFVVSSLSFSGRLAEDYAAKSWRARWWLLDGWLALLYLFSFGAITYLWRPSDGNTRLVLSDELAQSEEDADTYDLEALQHNRAREDDDNVTLVGSRGGVQTDHVVFEIGDEDDDDDVPHKKRSISNRPSLDERNGYAGEREGLMNGGSHSRARND